METNQRTYLCFQILTQMRESFFWGGHIEQNNPTQRSGGLAWMELKVTNRARRTSLRRVERMCGYDGPHVVLIQRIFNVR